MLNLAAIQADALELARVETHVRQGESGDLWLQRWQADTGTYADWQSIPHRWCYSEEDCKGNELPSTVAAELRVSELALTAATLQQVGRFRHGARYFQAMPPTPYLPTAAIRYWRFWLVSSDSLQAYGTDATYIRREPGTYNPATTSASQTETQHAIKCTIDDPITRELLNRTGTLTDVQADEVVLLVPGVELTFWPAIGDAVQIGTRVYQVRRVQGFGRVGERAISYTLVVK